MLKIGLIGCGTMGNTHAAAYKHLDSVEVVAVCDIDNEKARVVGELLNADVVNSFEELMKYDLDILDVCLPTYLHAKYSIPAMEKGIHVFCEKPMAINLEEAKKMIEVSKRNNVKLSIGHVLRFFPQYKHAISSIEQDVTGTPKLIRTVRNQGFPTWSWENWYNDYSKSGGPILDLIIHDIDWIIHNFGRVERVYAQTIKDNINVSNQDHVQCLLKLSNGMVGYLEGSWGLPTGSPFKMAYEIVGTKGQIEYDSTVQNSLKLQKNNGSYEETNLSPFSNNEEPYYLELKAFTEAVQNDTPVIVTPEEALMTLEVALACVESSELKKMISIEA